MLVEEVREEEEVGEGGGAEGVMDGMSWMLILWTTTAIPLP